MLATLTLTLALLPQATPPRTPPPHLDGQMVLVPSESLSDPDLIQRLDSIGGENATRFVLALSESTSIPGVDRCIAPRSLTDANDGPLARRLGEVDVLVLRGGSFMEWYDSTFHERGRTQLFHALLDRVRARKIVIAHGGAAAFMSAGTTIPRTELSERDGLARNPRYAHTQVPLAAMRLGPPALLDCDDWPGGSPLRWLHSLWQTRMDLGLYCVGDVALDYRREAREVRVLGPGSVLLCDLRRSRRMKRRLEGARLSILNRGDGWSLGFDRPLPAVKLRELEDAPGLLEPDALSLDAELASGAALVARLRGAAPDPAEDPPSTEANLEVGYDVGSSTWGRPSTERRTLLALPMRLQWETSLFQPERETRAPR